MDDLRGGGVAQKNLKELSLSHGAAEQHRAACQNNQWEVY